MRFKNFLKRFQVEHLTAVLKDTFARFPLSVTCCAGASLLSMLATHDIKLLDDEYLMRAMFFLGSGLVFFTVACLYAEGTQQTRTWESVLMAAGGFALLAEAVLPERFTAMQLLTSAALSLSMLFAPYIGRKTTEDSVWYYNYLNGLSLAIAGISTFVLGLGLCAIVGSMDYLLYDMKLSGKIYGDIWIFGWCFFGPVMFMHQIPRQFDFDKSECAVPKGIYFIANYLAVPLILIYMWVLYVYFLKIAIQWELPKGNLAYMVTGFGSFGVAARLAVFPMREHGTKLLQQFYRFFFLILIVPVLLLALGLYTRIAAYGITEERYAIGISLTWLTGITAWNLARPKLAHIKHVPMALSVLLLLAAVGPWGAVAVSAHSQSARLEALLRAAGVIHAGGVVAKTTLDVPFETRKDISGTLDYMFEGKQKAVARWVDPFRAEIEKKRKADHPGFDPSSCERELDFGRNWCDNDMPRMVMEAWGMVYVSRWETQENNYVTFQLPASVPGYGLGAQNILKVAPYSHVASMTPSPDGGDRGVVEVFGGEGPGGLKLKGTMTRDGVLTFTLGDGRKVSFNLQPTADGFYKEKLHQFIPEAESGRMTLKSASGDFPAEIHISEMHGHADGGNFRLDGLSLLLLFTP